MVMNEHLRVMKFGGTSVGDAACIARAAKIVAAAIDQSAVVVVVSAMSGVTDRLIEAARCAGTGDERTALELMTSLRGQHATAITALIKDADARAQLAAETERIIGGATNLCRGAAMLCELTPRTLAAISGAGERLSARLMTGALRELGVAGVAVEATELIVTDEQYQQAEPLMDETRARAQARLLPLLDEGATPVVTGFVGANAKGETTTLGRGGSDYSATILGAALGAVEVVIWTDVEGVLTADPRLIPEARTLREISYNEAAELAYFGAKVLHPRTLRPVTVAGIPVWIRNSFAPESPGTKITATGHPTASGVKAITAIGDVSLITLGGRGIVGAPDVVAKTFSATASERVNVLLISQASSQNDICFIVRSEDAGRVVRALRQAFAPELSRQEVEHITVDAEIAVVAAIGERMRGAVGIAGRTFGALGRAHINVIAIAQGSSEYNISFVVEAHAVKEAVAAVHEEFELGRRAPAGEQDEVAFTEVKG